MRRRLTDTEFAEYARSMQWTDNGARLTIASHLEKLGVVQEVDTRSALRGWWGSDGDCRCWLWIRVRVAYRRYGEWLCITMCEQCRKEGGEQ